MPTSSSERASDPRRAELAELAAGLRAAIARKRSLGLRRVRGLAPADAPPPAAPRASAPAPSGIGDWLVPQAPPASSPRNPALAGADLRAAVNRAKAAACSNLEELRAAVAACRACGLCETRTQTVFSDGQGRAGVMFIGEAPGADEDARGVPFVGRAGQLLTDIITKGMRVPRGEVYIANVLKCRPPDNRDPSEAEKRMCTPWLDRQIELLAPKVIVPLGRHAANHVLGTDLSMGRLRGQVHRRGPYEVVPTFHPAYLLRSPGMKRECWADIQVAMRLLGLERKP